MRSRARALWLSFLYLLLLRVSLVIVLTVYSQIGATDRNLKGWSVALNWPYTVIVDINIFLGSLEAFNFAQPSIYLLFKVSREIDSSKCPFLTFGNKINTTEMKSWKINDILPNQKKALLRTSTQMSRVHF